MREAKVSDQDEQDKQRRLKQFEDAARAIGREIEKRGLSEEEVILIVEKTRQKRFDERYGSRLR